MPRFHFHIMDGRTLHDPTGQELLDEEAALREARAIAEGMRRNDGIPAHWNRVRVTDHRGKEVVIVRVDNGKKE
jgi:hypothetical protein